jgi:ankyrin repeat protein
MNYSVTDKFGNTPLHHAAAEGNTKTILSSMLNHHISDSELAHRNTSGETFLHVFRIPPPSVHNMSSNESDFERYVKILKLASGQWFQFQIRDHYGRCVAQRLHELTNNWEVINRHHLKQVAEILGLKHNNKLVDEMSWLTAPSSAFRSDVDGYSKTRLSDLLLDCSTPPNELTAALENWPRTSLSGRPLQRLTDESDIHQRDSRGYTALTIAAGKGLREAVSLLLESGANPNTRSHQSTSVIAHATAKLAQAQKENKDDLYARVLSCIVLLSDHGAKATPTEYDEYCIFTPISKKKSTRFAPATFVKQTLGQISRNRSRTKAIKLSADSRNLGIIAEMSAVKDRVELDGWPPLSPGPAELGAEHGSSNLRRPNNGKQTWLYDIPEQVEDVSPVYTS